jgi:hypothetical protein
MSGLQMHPVTAELLAKAHRADLQADARYARLAREAREARSVKPQLTLVTTGRVTRRRFAATLVATALALGVIAGSAGAQATPAAAPAAVPAAAPAPAQYPTSGGGIHLHR